MQKVFKRTKTVRIFSILSGLIFLGCVIASIFSVVKQEYINFIFVSFALYLDIMFALIALIEYKGTLEINEIGIGFHYRVFSKSKKYNRRNVFLQWEDITYVLKNFTPGDGFFSANSTVYHFILQDDQEIEAYFFHFGKTAEQEIDCILKKYTTVISM